MTKEFDQLIKEVNLPSSQNKESQYNSFDAPVPGESLTNTPGAAAWEHPPTHSKVEDAIELINDKLMDKKNGMRVLTLLDIGIPIEALVKVITFSGFLEGKWTVDVAKMLDPLVAMLLAKITKDAKLNKVRINLNDPKDKEFIEDAKQYIPKVQATIVTHQEGVDESKCEDISRNEFGVNYRPRRYNIVG